MPAPVHCCVHHRSVHCMYAHCSTTIRIVMMGYRHVDYHSSMAMCCMSRMHRTMNGGKHDAFWAMAKRRAWALCHRSDAGNANCVLAIAVLNFKGMQLIIWTRWVDACDAPKLCIAYWSTTGCSERTQWTKAEYYIRMGFAQWFAVSHCTESQINTCFVCCWCMNLFFNSHFSSSNRHSIVRKRISHFHANFRLWRAKTTKTKMDLIKNVSDKWQLIQFSLTITFTASACDIKYARTQSNTHDSYIIHREALFFCRMCLWDHQSADKF